LEHDSANHRSSISIVDLVESNPPKDFPSIRNTPAFTTSKFPHANTGSLLQPSQALLPFASSHPQPHHLSTIYQPTLTTNSTQTTPPKLAQVLAARSKNSFFGDNGCTTFFYVTAFHFIESFFHWAINNNGFIITIPFYEWNSP